MFACVYTYVVSREEDCLTCFNRFEEIHFSRYQVRRDNSIEKETWQSTKQKMLVDK